MALASMRVTWTMLFCLSITSLAPGSGHAEGTPVARGDTLFVSVFRLPEIERNARVDMDGRINLPLVGRVEVAGADIDTVRERISEALIEQNIVLDPSVLVEVASYRPIYIGGAVRNSGPIPFEPGLTVRHAVIAAGGRSMTVGKSAPELGRVLELLATRRAATQALARVDSEIARHRATLEGDEAQAEQIEEELTELDYALLQDLRRREADDLDHAETAIELVETELEVLSGQAELQLAEQELQREEVARTQTLVERGLVPTAKLSDLRREGSRLSRDILANQAFAARAAQERADIRNRTRVVETERRIATREAEREALSRRAALLAEIERVSGHLLAAGREEEAEPAVESSAVIFRKVGGVTRELQAMPETVLAPGDILEISPAALPQG